MKRMAGNLVFTLLWIIPIVSLTMAQDRRLAVIKSVYIVPSDMRGTVRQLQKRIPEKLGWRVVYNPAEADALIGVSQSESVTGYWIYEGPGTITATTRLVGNVAYTSGTATSGPRTVTTFRKRYGHVVIYDARSSDLLYNYSTRLWFRWSKLTGGFLKDIRKQVGRMTRVVAGSTDNAPPASEAVESPEPDFDFSRYATYEQFDGHAWNNMPESVKVGYLIGYIVALNTIKQDIGSVFERVNPSAGVSPLLAASRTERSKLETAQSVLEQQAVAVIESRQIGETLQQILVRLERFYENSQNLPVPVTEAIVEVLGR